MQWSFMSESRRLDNTRMKRELRLRLRYPTVVAGIAAAQGVIMLWLKAFHILFVTSWFAGLFYLPRIFVNLAMVPADSDAERERLLLMAGKLFRFMTPLGVLAVGLGLWLWFGYGFSGGWLHAKTALVIGLASPTTPGAACCWPNSARAVRSRAMSGSASSTRCRCWR
jgi:uncharacterized membrane protein